MVRSKPYNPHEITDVQVTSDRLTSRAGLNLFVRYLKGIDLLPHLERMFGSIRKRSSGLSVSTLFTQVFCFFFDGTSRHLVHFDQLAKDEGYAAAIETAPADMASSHQIKRFFGGFTWLRNRLFRRLLQHLFLWRLSLVQPKVIILGLDTMVLDNDDASKREGVKPTYKKVKGFAPLQLTWEGFIIDAVFRGGDKHSNHGDTAANLMRHVVRRIRKQYRPEVPILLRMDAGFFDQDLFNTLEEMGVGYSAGGRWFGDLRSHLGSQPEEAWQSYDEQPSDEGWEYLDFTDQRKNWDRPRRVVCFRTLRQGPQLLLPGTRPGTLVYTNLGRGSEVDRQLEQAGASHLITAKSLIRTYADRGVDELIHRALKDFGFEALPFKRFTANEAFYFCMLVGFFLFRCFQQDVTAEVVPGTSYPTRVRRQIIDLAAKFVSHAGRLVLKITATAMEALQFKRLWLLSGSPPRFAWT